MPLNLMGLMSLRSTVRSSDLIMKFQEAHRLDILECFKKAGLLRSLFFFRKKKGRIFIEHIESKVWLSYYYKDDSYIDVTTTKRVEVGSWEVKTSSKEESQVDDWNKVLKLLKQWLQQFK